MFTSGTIFIRPCSRGADSKAIPVIVSPFSQPCQSVHASGRPSILPSVRPFAPRARAACASILPSAHASVLPPVHASFLPHVRPSVGAHGSTSVHPSSFACAPSLASTPMPQLLFVTHSILICSTFSLCSSTLFRTPHKCSAHRRRTCNVTAMIPKLTLLWQIFMFVSLHFVIRCFVD